jgi:hypothetical protein
MRTSLTISAAACLVVAVILSTAGVAVSHAYIQRENADATLTAQDYIEIQRLYASMTRALDRADGDGYARTFVENGVQGNLAGTKALADLVKNYYDPSKKNPRLRHLIKNLSITGSHERATGLAYQLIVNVENKPPTISSLGNEEDLLVRTPDGWRFQNRGIRTEPFQ